MSSYDRLIPLSQELDWHNALQGLPHAIGHTWDFWQAVHLTSGQDIYLYLLEEGDVRLICPFAERAYRESRDIVSLPGLSGFTGNGFSPVVMDRWTTWAREQRYVCAYIGQHPALLQTVSLKNYGAQKYSSAYLLDLTLPLEEIHHRMSETRKRDLRYAERNGVHVWINTPPVKRYFVTRFEETFRRRNGRTDHYLSEAARNFLSTQEGFLFLGAGRAEIESATVFGFTPYAADGLFNVSSAPNTSFSTVLIWAAVQELKARKIPVLNLGGGLRPHDGLAEYKQYLGATARPLFCWKQIFDPVRFRELCELAGVPASDTFFPPYHRPAEDGKRASADRS
ncbi:MAG: hypothetical protein C5B51_08110 [Terriglobia bacterium]|nr:MAG: hypothetical protein C5B51_08110 [Terriglobia bacterium]